MPHSKLDAAAMYYKEDDEEGYASWLVNRVRQQEKLLIEAYALVNPGDIDHYKEDGKTWHERVKELLDEA